MNRLWPVLCSLLILQLTFGNQKRSEGARFCDFKEHKYFHPQVPRCKICDMCYVGLGLVSIKDEAIRLRPDHGALSCQRCSECLAGKTFSDDISYQPCRPCKNCASLGMEESERCTPYSNTKCQKITPPPKRKTIAPSNTRDKQSDGRDVTENIESNDKWIILVGVVVVIILVVCIPCALIWYCEHWSQVEERFIRAKNKLKTTSNRLAQPLAVQQPLVPQDGPLHERDLCTPANLLVKDEDYFQLGLRLGIASYELHIINADNRDSARKKSFEVLNKWRKMNGNNATRGLFYNALRRIKRADVIAEMEKERKTDNGGGDHTGLSTLGVDERRGNGVHIRLGIKVRLSQL